MSTSSLPPHKNIGIQKQSSSGKLPTEISFNNFKEAARQAAIVESSAEKPNSETQVEGKI